MAKCVGLDWGGREHGVCVVERASGAVAARFMVRHDAAGLADLVKRLARLGPPGELPVAIERPNGLVVETLMAVGHPIVPIHPNVVKASRPRYSAAGAKSDPGDCYLLADLQRTDGHRFRPLMPCSPGLKALQALVRGRAALVRQRVALANQLRTLLEGFWPGAGVLFAAIDSPIALVFVERYPTPASAARLGEQRLRAFLVRHAYSGRRSAAELLARLKAAPQGRASVAEAEAKGVLVRALASVLTRLGAQIRAVTQRIERDVAALPDGPILMSFPCAGRLCAAQILVELGDVRERFQSADQLAAEAGVCPVTRQSGKSRGVVFRWACNHRLRHAITGLADNSRHACPWAADIYQRAKARGCPHPHAVRILARAWIRVLWRAWTERKPYDPACHRGALALAA
ncbi:IS110 family transposase [Labrys miyagiensis]|uniref:IS110 family transposase n=1 Tax=Labrys miyagiensis TaxID=346912 RepID=A0ABQ6CVB1_9HYPH|nr:IS110 family transposase [Labrys miyagiensis]GLS24288.1 IS110 family transposase [Labrys miyagiensis]